jgi:hypothetical protein
MKFKFEHQINYLEWKANNFIIKLKKVTNNIINKKNKKKMKIMKKIKMKIVAIYIATLQLLKKKKLKII